MSSVLDFISFNIARFNRIRRKPPREILTFFIKRTRQAIVHLRDKVRMIFGEIQIDDRDFFKKLHLNDQALMTVKEAIDQGDLEAAEERIVSHMRKRDTPKFFFNRQEKERMMAILEKQFPGSKEATINLAQEFVDHRFHLLGKNVKFDENIDWHSSITTRERWPLSFSPNIDYLSPRRVGDIKLAWELNRTQHFVTLGKAYWFTGDERYAREFTDQLISWIEGNPYKIGINWMEGIETAIRLVSWVWAYYFFLDSKEFNERGHFEFLKSIYLQARYIEEHLSDKWQINNNHLIAEATGLVLMGIMFPEFEEADRWKRKGIELLERELGTQILSDGVTWEQSTGYQKFVTDFCLFVVVLMMKNGMRISDRILSKLTRMIDFLNSITKEGGKIPLIGDEDQGKVVKVDDTVYDDTRSTVTLGSIILKRKDWLTRKSEEAFWLLGTRALIKESKPIAHESRLFEDSGFLVMRAKDKYLLFFVGPQNPKYLHASHRHLDMLSFVLDAYGTCFIVDPGTYTYLGDIKWRRFFKSVKSHNTVVVDDKDPTEIDEVFEMSRFPLARVTDYASSEKFDWVTARHEGYKSIIHVREFFFVKPEYWIVIDLLEGNGKHNYDLYFHLDHGLDLKCDNATMSATARTLTGNLRISPVKTSELDWEILDGEVSPRYGVKVKAPVLRYRRKGEPPIMFTTMLYPYRDELLRTKVSQIDIHGESGKVLSENVASGIKVDFGERVDYFVCSHTGEQQCFFFENFGPLKGKTVYIRKERTKPSEELVF